MASFSIFHWAILFIIGVVVYSIFKSGAAAKKHKAEDFSIGQRAAPNNKTKDTQ
jgi:hypothetical protein